MAEKVYVLRTCGADGTSRNGFKWPKRGKVEAPDWNPEPVCGKGLHGALWGEGNGGLFNWSVRARWQVVRVDSELVDLKGKVKFQCGYVVFTGTQKAATDKIIKLGAKGAVIGAFVVSEYKGTSISGYGGTSISGYESMSLSGDCGTSTSGYFGTSISGREGTSTSGDFGTIQITYRCNKTNRKKIKTGYIGEDGLKPNVAYKLDDSNEFVEADAHPDDRDRPSPRLWPWGGVKSLDARRIVGKGTIFTLCPDKSRAQKQKGQNE